MAVPKDPRELETAEPFVSLFEIQPEKQALITRSMRERGYVKDQPILAWRDAFGVKGRIVVVDGHTRRLAALDAGLKEVTVTLRRYNSADEAWAETVHEQAARRNFTNSQLVVSVLVGLANFDTGQRGSGARNDLVGRSAQQLADMLGVSRPTIERARALLMFGEPDLIERVKAGDMGLKQAADLARKAGQEDERKNGGRARGGSANDDLIETAPEPEEPGMSELAKIAAEISALADRLEVVSAELGEPNDLVLAMADLMSAQTRIEDAAIEAAKPPA